MVVASTLQQLRRGAQGVRRVGGTWLEELFVDVLIISHTLTFRNMHTSIRATHYSLTAQLSTNMYAQHNTNARAVKMKRGWRPL